MFINSIFESLKVYWVIKVREVRIAKEVKRSDGWWRFACGNVCKPCACTLCTLSTLWVHLSSYRSAAVLTWWPSSPRNLCWLMDHWLVWWTFDIIDEPKPREVNFFLRKEIYLPGSVPGRGNSHAIYAKEDLRSKWVTFVGLILGGQTNMWTRMNLKQGDKL